MLIHTIKRDKSNAFRLKLMDYFSLCQTTKVYRVKEIDYSKPYVVRLRVFGKIEWFEYKLDRRVFKVYYEYYYKKNKNILNRRFKTSKLTLNEYLISQNKAPIS